MICCIQCCIFLSLKSNLYRNWTHSRFNLKRHSGRQQPKQSRSWIHGILHYHTLPMALHDDKTGSRLFIAASIWCSEVRATCVTENQLAELREIAGRTTNITEAPLFRGDTISGAKAAFPDFEDRGASLPRGVVARFGWSKKLKSSSLKGQYPLALPK